MSAEITCDGCGKKAQMRAAHGQWHKPQSWFERSDDDGTQSACSRECIDKIAAESGKTSVVIPI